MHLNLDQCFCFHTMKEKDVNDCHLNPLMPNGAFNICCPRDCVSRPNGGNSGAPIMPRDAVSRTANVERTGQNKWVKNIYIYTKHPSFPFPCIPKSAIKKYHTRSLPNPNTTFYVSILLVTILLLCILYFLLCITILLLSIFYL